MYKVVWHFCGAPLHCAWLTYISDLNPCPCLKLIGYTGVTYHIYEGYSKIKLRLVGKNKRVGIAPNHMLSRNKQGLFSVNTNPHAFSLLSLWVIADEIWTISLPHRQLRGTCCNPFSSRRRTKRDRDSLSIVSCVWWYCYEWQLCEKMV